MKIVEILSQIQHDLKAPKGQFNNFGKYKYRSCEDIVEAVKQVLAKHNGTLILSDEMVHIGDRYYIKASAMLHVGDEIMTAYGYARETENRKGMDESQITGTASSYARKYALNGLFAIDDTKDADNESVSKEAVIGEMSGEPVNMDKVNKAAAWAKKVIDKDDLEHGAPLVQEKWELLTNDEKMQIGGLLKDKAPGSKKMYGTLLTEYLKYTKEGVMK